MCFRCEVVAICAALTSIGSSVCDIYAVTVMSTTVLAIITAAIAILTVTVLIFSGPRCKE